MKRTIKLTHAVLAIAVALALGSSGTWAYLNQSNERSIQEMMLAHDLVTMSLCAGSLKLSRAGAHEQLTYFLERDLEFALAHADRLTARGTRLSLLAPNLRESIRRTATHYEATGQVEKQRRADALFARLKSN